MSNECEHEPEDIGLEYFMIVMKDDREEDDDVIEISLCSKCHLLYWDYTKAKKDGR